MNKFTCFGYLGKDAEIKEGTRGKYAALNLAVKFKEETQWVKCMIWPDRMIAFQKIIPWLKKGSFIAVEGKLDKPQIYETQDGRKVINLCISVTDINFIPKSKSEEPKKHEEKEIVQGQGRSIFEEQEELPF